EGFKMRCKLTLSGHSAPVLTCALSNDGHTLVSGSVDKSVIVYDVKTGCILYILTHHTRYVTSCALAPKHLLLATGSMDNTVKIWKLGQTDDLAVSRLERESERRMRETHVEGWSEEDVTAWLSDGGLTDMKQLFKVNNIDGKELLSLTKESLQNDLKIESLGLRNKILRKIEALKSKMMAATLDIPDEFLCPITREIMCDPVIASGTV
ncbi:hypothetical protein FKM82_022190, partial [Ascaphus truei]